MFDEQYLQILSNESQNTAIFDRNKKNSVLLVSPSNYRQMMESMGIQKLYCEANKHSNFNAERSCLLTPEPTIPGIDALVYSLEQQKQPSNFDVLGFSLSNPMQFKDFFKWMQLADIPLRKEDRDENYPLIIAGGMGITNPQPFVPFVDVFFMGDALGSFRELLDKYNSKNTKMQTLETLSKISGVYVPDVSRERIIPRIESECGAFLSHIIAGDEASLIIDYGCKFGCSFCEYTHNKRKYTAYDTKEILELIDQAKKRGVKKLFLYSASAKNHSNIKTILDKLEKEKISVQLQAIRTEQMDDVMIGYFKKNLDLLPLNADAPSDKLRLKYKPKSLSTEEIYNLAVHANKKFDIDHFALYYIINYPKETESDREEISKLTNKLLELSPKVFVDLYINPLFPSPNTPLERAEMAHPLLTFERIDRIWQKIDFREENFYAPDKRVYKYSQHKREYSGNRVSIFSASVIDQTIEGITLRGDFHSGEIVLDLFKNGYLFGKSSDNEQKMFEYLDSVHPEWTQYLAEISPSTNLPWINTTSTKGELILQ